MGVFGAVLGPSWQIMGAFGGLLGALWNDPHPTWHVMGHLGADLTRPGGVLDRPGPRLGGPWSLMAADLTRLGGVLDRPGPHLGASWSLMAAMTEKTPKRSQFWPLLEPSWPPFSRFLVACSDDFFMIFFPDRRRPEAN